MTDRLNATPATGRGYSTRILRCEDKTRRGPWIGFAALVGALAVVVAAGDLRASPWSCAAALVAAVGGALLVVRGAAAAPPLALLLALLGLRAVAVCASPSLSDDQYRYVHEGRAQRVGLATPYATPPAAITPLPDDGTTARVNHPDVPAAYPPGSELVLWLTVSLGDALGRPMLALRALLVGADVLVLWLLFRRRQAAPLAFVLYGAHPLPLLEIVVGAHLDGLGVAALLAAVLTSRPVLKGVLIGLATHAKPIAALGLVALPWRRCKRVLAGALVGFALAVAAPALPHVLAGAPLSRGLLEYATRWRAAPFLYGALEAPLRPAFAARAAAGRYAHLHVTLSPWRDAGWLVEDAGVPLASLGAGKISARPLLLDAAFFGRLLAGALLAMVAVVIARSRASPEGKVGAALAALWLLAPTVHPWYLTWLVPFAALSSSRALLFFAGTAPLLYQPVFAFAATGVWHEALWPRLLVMGALLIGAALDLRSARSARSARSLRSAQAADP